MHPSLILCIVTALGFGSWTLIARASGATGGWIIAVVMSMSALTSTLFQRPTLGTFPTGTALLTLLAAGLANGIGAVAFSRLITAPGTAMSSLPSAALTAMICVTAIGGFLFFKEPVTGSRLLGLAFAAAGCWLLTK